MQITLDDILKEYKAKFGYTPVLGRGDASTHMDLLLDALDSDTPLEEEYSEADPTDVFL